MLDQELEDIIRGVLRPGRYAGGEWNAAAKDWGAAEVTVALCYPDFYEAGAGNYGYQSLYNAINRDSRFVCERVFLPWPDMARQLRDRRISLFSLESHRPVTEFQAACFYLDSGLRYPNVLEMLDLSSVPLEHESRGAPYPVVIGCGPAAGNPRPIETFFDCFTLGDPEEGVTSLLEGLASEGRGKSGRRFDILREGVYVPAAPLTGSSGREDGMNSRGEDAAHSTVRARFSPSVPQSPARPVVPSLEAIPDYGVVEVGREGGPPRVRSASDTIEAVLGLVQNAGYSEVALTSHVPVGLDWLAEVVQGLRARYSPEDLMVHPPPLPIEPAAVPVLDALIGSRKRLGYPVELQSGAERLRMLFGRSVSNEGLFAVLEEAIRRGWDGVRYRLTVGLPGETMEDVEALLHIVGETQRIGFRSSGRRTRVRALVSVFIPRPHTSWEREAMDSPEALGEKVQLLRKGFKRAGAHASLPDVQSAVVEGALARGDASLAPVVRLAWLQGLDSGDLGTARWTSAFGSLALDPAAHACRQWTRDAELPWSHLDFGITRGLMGVASHGNPAARRTPQ